MMVVLAHCGYRVFSSALGVNIFFFLSGFLITTLLRREYALKGKLNLKHFYMRRVLRIFPPLYVFLCVVLGLALLGVLKGPVDGRAVAGQFLQFTNYIWIAEIPLIPGSHVLWSLSVEEHYYLVFPFLFTLFYPVWSKKTTVFVLVTICLAILAYRFSIILPNLSLTNNEAYVGTHTRIDSIMWGALIALVANPYFEPERSKKLAIPWVGVVAFLVIGFSQAFQVEWYWQTLRYTLQCVCLIPLLLLAIHYPKAQPFKLLNTKALIWIGTISYGMYLYHYIAFSVLNDNFDLDRIPYTLVVLTFTFTVSSLSYYFMEKPLGRLRKKLGV